MLLRPPPSPAIERISYGMPAVAAHVERWAAERTPEHVQPLGMTHCPLPTSSVARKVACMWTRVDSHLNQMSTLFKWLVFVPAVLGVAMYLGTLLSIGTAVAAHLKALAGICLGIASLVFMATTWLNCAPLTYQGGLDPKSRPVRYHAGMFFLTAVALGLVVTGGLMLHAVVLAAM